MAFGGPLPVHHVKCLGCGAPLQLRTHWRRPRCAACRHKKKKGDENGRHKSVVRQARRYRIILHVLGWEDEQFDEMVAEMRRSPMAFRKKPETRAARFDLAIEERRA